MTSTSLLNRLGCSSVDITRAEALGVPTEAAAREDLSCLDSAIKSEL